MPLNVNSTVRTDVFSNDPAENLMKTLKRTYAIRSGGHHEIPLLQAIETDAGRLFLDTPYPELADDDPSPEMELAQAADSGRLIVAADLDDAPVGFLYFADLGDIAFIEEVSVRRDHGRQGLGRRLVEAAIQTAEAQGFRLIGLTTFRNVAWNAPFYQKLGFTIAENRIAPALAEALAAEEGRGLPMADRVVMQRRLAGA